MAAGAVVGGVTAGIVAGAIGEPGDVFVAAAAVSAPLPMAG